MEPKIQAVDGNEVVNKIKGNVEEMLSKKVIAVTVSWLFWFLCLYCSLCEAQNSHSEFTWLTNVEY